MSARISIALFLLLGGGSAGAAADDPSGAFGIGPWQLGMGRDAALAFKDNGPYVAGSNFDERDASALFQNSKVAVSLAFDAPGLRSIQVRKYEGNDLAAAKAAALELFDLFAARFGGASVENVQADGGKPLDRAALGEALDKILGTATALAAHARSKDKALLLITFDMIPTRQPAGSRLHSQWGYSATTGRYYVYLFQDRIDAPLRRARSNVFLERIRQP
jgi:hypothetical protein